MAFIVMPHQRAGIATLSIRSAAHSDEKRRMAVRFASNIEQISELVSDRPAAG